MSLNRSDSFKNIEHKEIKIESKPTVTVNWEHVVKLIKSENLGELVEFLTVHLSEVQKLKGKRGETILIEAIIEGVSDNITDFLIGSKQIDSLIKKTTGMSTYLINVRDFSSTTPLMHAAAKERHTLVKSLLTQRAIADLRDLDGKTALMYAKDAKVMQELIKGGADVNAADGYNKTVLLHIVQQGGLEEIKMLLKKGAKVNAVDKEKKSALMYAAERGDINILKLLIEQKADLKAKDKLGNTARDYVDKTKPNALLLSKLLPMTAASFMEYNTVTNSPKSKSHTLYKIANSDSTQEVDPETESLIGLREWKP